MMLATLLACEELTTRAFAMPYCANGTCLFTKTTSAVESIGAVPLIVLSRGLDPEQDWQAMQTDLLHLSSNSQQLFADKSGHNIQLDQPEAAVGAIVTMVEQIRRQAMQ
jgi:pimeloyl-ACP methyl ester carboxylesterase